MSDTLLNQYGAGRPMMEMGYSSTPGMEYRIMPSNHNKEASALDGNMVSLPFQACFGEQELGNDHYYDADDEDEGDDGDGGYDELDVAAEIFNSMLDTILEEVREWMGRRQPLNRPQLQSDARTVSTLDLDDFTEVTNASADTDIDSIASQYMFEDVLDDTATHESDSDFGSTTSSSDSTSESRGSHVKHFLSCLPVASRSVDGEYEDCFCGDAYGHLCHAPLVLPCRHVFGRKCLQAWFTSDNQNSNTCPMCRQMLFERL